MPFKLEAKCPCCGVEAKHNLKELERIFGFRIMANGEKILQSYCRKCRGLKCSPGNKRCQQ